LCNWPLPGEGGGVFAVSGPAGCCDA